ALIEVNLLAKLKEWDPNRRHGVVNFTQSFYWRGHLCISTELLGMNLYELIKAHDFKGFSLRIIRRFASQILSTLLLLRQHKVIHCDLKPENILLVHPLKSEIKVIDFGSSCFENEKVYTYIQSRFYRSPEVILGMPYGMPIDMWSLGCIMAELYTGNPIFPGENEQEQLACIMEIFGPPERHLIERSSRRKLFFDSNGKPRTIVSSKGRRRRPSSKDLKQALKCDNDVFLDFIARCLRWDPNRRLNPVDALNHEFITGVKAPPRPRHYGSSSSVRRVLNMRPPFTPPSNTVSGASKASTSAINSTAVRSSASRSTHISSSSKFSPAAGDTTRRQYNIGRTGNSSSATTGTRGRRLKTHTSSSSLIGSSLPRVSQRSVSTKADLATAAAAMSLPS
ncbi:serine/threonine protein kinase, CMGC, dual-specificity, partial [Ascosphaera atra]